MAEKTPTPTIEDYLGIIYTLERDGEVVIGARLSELLEVSPPTVTVTLRRMVRDGWIKIDNSKKIRLTSKGITAAHKVIRRHMLTEWMLAKILNLPWSKIHEEAHKIEHTISNDVEKSLIDKLNAPGSMPAWKSDARHGSAIQRLGTAGGYASRRSNDHQTRT